MHSDFVCPRISFSSSVCERICFYTEIEPAKRGRKNGDVKNGTKTLRFKADGQASIEEADGSMDKAIDRINGLLETYMGINDSDLGKLVSISAVSEIWETNENVIWISIDTLFSLSAQQIWDLAENQKNPSDFATAIDESDIGAFNFADDFIFDIWAAIDDIKSGRMPSQKEFESERL